MANKKRSDKGQEINVNLSDLFRVGMKLMPQLIPIAKEIANEMNVDGQDSVELFKEKKVSKPKKKVSKKRVPKVHKESKGVGLCNKRIKDKSKLSRTWDKVTCDNCLAKKK